MTTHIRWQSEELMVVLKLEVLKLVEVLEQVGLEVLKLVAGQPQHLKVLQTSKSVDVVEPHDLLKRMAQALG